MTSMTDIDLLPLPEGESSSFGDYEVHDNETMIEYARANVARNTALLRAEIEALLEELDAMEAENEWLLAERDALTAEVERLREALRGLEEREQRDEALLRQALDALELRCGTHADERKDLIPALRERLGEGGAMIYAKETSNE